MYDIKTMGESQIVGFQLRKPYTGEKHAWHQDYGLVSNCRV